MATEVVTHRVVYLKNVELAKRSRHHTAYAGDGPIGGKIYKLTFVNGVARDVEDTLYRRFYDLGIADINRPVVEKLEDEY